MVRDLSDPYADLRKLKSQQRRQQSATPLRNATVSGGRTNYIGNESLVVTGSEVINGGSVVNGTQTVNGESILNGTQTVDGNIEVNDGSITVPGPNPIKIWQAPGGAVIEMGPGLLWAAGNDVSFGGSAGSSAFIVLNAATGSVKIVTVSAGITVDANGITFQGLPAIGRTTVTPNVPVGTLIANASGRVFRAV